jgi:hypothetical protein
MTMAAKAKRGKSKSDSERKLDTQLDDALTDTFPASDPVSVGSFTSTEPPARPIDRKAPVIDLEDVAAARRKRR